MSTQHTLTWPPIEVSDVMLAFPADVRHLMPPEQSIPAPYWESDDSWPRRLFNDMFFRGLKPGVAFYARDGIDPRTAVRHLQAVMRSFQPQHEYKEAACRFLFDLWFEKVEWEALS